MTPSTGQKIRPNCPLRSEPEAFTAHECPWAIAGRSGRPLVRSHGGQIFLARMLVNQTEYKCQHDRTSLLGRGHLMQIIVSGRLRAPGKTASSDCRLRFVRNPALSRPRAAALASRAAAIGTEAEPAAASLARETAEALKEGPPKDCILGGPSGLGGEPGRLGVPARPVKSCRLWATGQRFTSEQNRS